jgi:hypothetical protein
MSGQNTPSDIRVMSPAPLVLAYIIRHPEAVSDRIPAELMQWRGTNAKSK